MRSPSLELVLPMPLKVPQRTSSAYHQSLDPAPPAILLQIPSIQLYISTHEPRSRLHRSFHLPYHPLSRPSSYQAAPNSSPLSSSIHQRPNPIIARTLPITQQTWRPLELLPSKSFAIFRRRQALFRPSGVFTSLVPIRIHAHWSSPRNTAMLHSASKH